mmetsp:Transcript_31282/g.36130  ORF Transcript_31282/g.36130 Transcript_31282/m.36130 type:complete len:286 (+) Transcript_31282:744-1601(+)
MRACIHNAPAGAFHRSVKRVGAVYARVLHQVIWKEPHSVFRAQGVICDALDHRLSEGYRRGISIFLSGVVGCTEANKDFSIHSFVEDDARSQVSHVHHSRGVDSHIGFTSHTRCHHTLKRPCEGLLLFIRQRDSLTALRMINPAVIRLRCSNFSDLVAVEWIQLSLPQSQQLSELHDDGVKHAAVTPRHRDHNEEQNTGDEKLDHRPYNWRCRRKRNLEIKRNRSKAGKKHIRVVRRPFPCVQIQCHHLHGKQYRLDKLIKRHALVKNRGRFQRDQLLSFIFRIR